MKVLNILYLSFFIFNLSCISEKPNFSPITENFTSSFSNNKTAANNDFNASDTTQKIFFSSQISDLISSFPRFSNYEVNRNVILLKEDLKNYVISVNSENKYKRNRSLKQFQKDYKNLQSLRKYISEDEDEVLNRYLVNLKTNVSMLESMDKDQ